MLQGGSGDVWTDEAGQPNLTPVTQSAWDMEQVVRNSRLDWLILRGGLFYRPGTGLDAAWREAAPPGTRTITGDWRRIGSLLRFSDIAEVHARSIVAPRSMAPPVSEVRTM